MPAPSVSPQAGLIRRLAAWRLPLGIALVLLAFALIEPRVISAANLRNIAAQPFTHSRHVIHKADS